MESNHADSQKTRASAIGKVADIHTAAKILARPRRRDLSDRDCAWALAQTRLSGTVVRIGVCNKEAIPPASLAVSGYGMIEGVSVCDADTMELIRKLLRSDHSDPSEKVGCSGHPDRGL